MSTNEKISKALIRIIRKLQAIDARFYKSAYNPNPKFLEDLTPQYESEQGNTYSKTILWAIRNPAVKNLALTGSYGSGKSTIIKTFEADHKEYCYLNISLASFEEEIQSDDDLRKKIEISILQQIFYKVSTRKVPFSRFRRIRNTPPWRFVLSAIFLLIWTAAATFIFKPTFFNRLSWWAAYVKANADMTLYIATTLFILGSIFILSRIFRNYNSARFQKLNVSNGELQLAEEADTSILNKHLDEILYFFEETEYNVVIIEDLDRFKDPEIFTKLRELNNLINSSSQIRRKVTFIYALKDDIFKDNNRAKFFDFLIPVIPVINSSNSGEKLLKKFKDSGTQGSLTDTFISDITLFIEDMRMLKNIYNEYTLYKSKIGLKVNEEKLLGIIVYKNFYPSDFAGLNVNDGLVFESFKYKQEAVKKIQAINEQKIAALEQRINILENEHLANISELRSVYVMSIINKIENGYKYRIGGTSFDNIHLLGDEFFDQLASTNPIQYLQSGYGQWNNANFTFKSIEKAINPKLSYSERLALIDAKIKGEKTASRIKIDKLNQQNTEMQGWSLRALIDKESISVLFEGAAKAKLLTYLLRRGYIDEMYHSYISFFYEGTITRTDMDFVIAVKNFAPLDFGFELTKIDQIVKKFNLPEYQQKEMLNIQLLDYLAQNNLSRKSELYAFIHQLVNKSPKSDEFLETYLSKGKMAGSVMQKMCKIWPGIWGHILTIYNTSPEKLITFLKSILLNGEVSDLVQINNDNSLSDYICRKSDFLLLFKNTEFPKIKKVIEGLSLEFKELKYREESKELIDYVYTNSHYEISAEMIEILLKIYGQADDELSQNLATKNYETILKSGCNPLINYINENWDVYLQEVFLALPEHSDDDGELFIPIMNSNIADDLKVAVLHKMTGVFDDILELPVDLWTSAMRENTLMPDWKNLILYFNMEGKDDEVITEWLNNEGNYQLLHDESMGDTDGDDAETIKEISKSILLNTGLTDEAYEQLITCIPWAYTSLAFETLPKSKIEILLKTGRLGFNKATYDLIKKHFNGLNITLLTQNYIKYLAAIDEYVFDGSDYLHLFRSPRITIVQKLDLIQNIDSALVNTFALSEAITQVLITSPAKISTELLRKIITKLIANEQKVKLLIMNFTALSKEEIMELLETLGGNYAQIAVKGKRPSIPDTPDNLDLVKRLAVYEYIASYKREKTKIIISTKRK